MLHLTPFRINTSKIFVFLGSVDSARLSSSLTPFKINTSKNSRNPRIPLISHAFNPPTINTSKNKDLKSPRINTSRHKDLKSFRINTSKKQGGGGLIVVENHHPSLRPTFASPRSLTRAEPAIATEGVWRRRAHLRSSFREVFDARPPWRACPPTARESKGPLPSSYVFGVNPTSAARRDLLLPSLRSLLIPRSLRRGISPSPL